VALRPTIEKLIRAVPRVLITNHLLDAHLVSDEAPWSESSLFLSLPQCRLALQFVCQIGTDTRPHRFVEAEAIAMESTCLASIHWHVAHTLSNS
jgi:hypothetical protein